MHSQVIKEKAIKLRLQGHSFNQISSELAISKSTLYGWLEDIQLSEKAQQIIKDRVREGSLKGLIIRNRKQTHQARERAHQTRLESSKWINTLSERDLLILGAALYWGEGYKRPKVVRGKERTHHPISLTNSDPTLIAVFMKFLRVCLKVPDSVVKAEVHIYKHVNDQQAIQYWANIMQLPTTNFGKIYRGISRASLGKKPYNRLPYGTVQVRVNSTKLFYTIMGLIDGIKNQV